MKFMTKGSRSNRPIIVPTEIHTEDVRTSSRSRAGLMGFSMIAATAIVILLAWLNLLLKDEPERTGQAEIEEESRAPERPITTEIRPKNTAPQAAERSPLEEGESHVETPEQDTADSLLSTAQPPATTVAPTIPQLPPTATKPGQPSRSKSRPPPAAKVAPKPAVGPMQLPQHRQSPATKPSSRAVGPELRKQSQTRPSYLPRVATEQPKAEMNPSPWESKERADTPSQSLETLPNFKKTIGLQEAKAQLSESQLRSSEPQAQERPEPEPLALPSFETEIDVLAQQAKPRRPLRLPDLPSNMLPLLSGKEIRVRVIVDRFGPAQASLVDTPDVSPYIIRRIVHDIEGQHWIRLGHNATTSQDIKLHVVYRWTR